MSLPQVLPFETDLPEWVCDRVQSLGSDEWDDVQRLWKRVATIAELLELYPPHSKQRKELQTLVAQVTRRKKVTQTLYHRIWQALADGVDEPHIPTNIDFSTVREIIQHGGTLGDIVRADAESWTLADAKLWSQSRTRICDSKPITRWRYLTRQTDRGWRKSTETLTDSEIYEATQKYRTLLCEWRQSIGRDV